jgi:hypothetical protein
MVQYNHNKINFDNPIDLIFSSSIVKKIIV